MKNLTAKLLILVAAIGLSFLSYELINGWFNIIPWAIAALLTGYFSGSRRAVITGLYSGMFYYWCIFYWGIAAKRIRVASLNLLHLMWYLVWLASYRGPFGLLWGTW